ncbi:MAG: SPOR domain-containing protein [Bacteroidota bacterium]
MKNSMPGFRIQVFFGPERVKAQETKTQLSALYPENQAYLVYQQPNFKVRLGDFKTRLEASRFLQEVQGSYPGAFIVPDEVRLPEL